MSAPNYTTYWFGQKKASCAVKNHQRGHWQNLERRSTGDQGVIRKQEGETVSRASSARNKKRDSDRKYCCMCKEFKEIGETYIVAQDEVNMKSWLGSTAWQDAECLLNAHSSLQSHDLHLIFWYWIDWHSIAFHKSSIMLEQLSRRQHFYIRQNKQVGYLPLINPYWYGNSWCWD